MAGIDKKVTQLDQFVGGLQGNEIIKVVKNGADFKVPVSKIFGKQGEKGDKGDTAPMPRDWYTTSSMTAPTATLGAVTAENPVVSMTVFAKEAGTYNNLKLANGTAAAAIVISADDMKAPFVFLNYNKTTDTWIKDVKSINVEANVQAALAPVVSVVENETPFTVGGTGTWGGTVGGNATLAPNASWNGSAKIVVGGNATVNLKNVYLTSATNGVCIALDANDKIISIIQAGANYASGNITITTPSNTAAIYLNINNTNASFPVSSARVNIKASNINKSALTQVYTDFNPVLPVAKTIETTTFGLQAGGLTPGSISNAIYINPRFISGLVTTVNFRASAAGTAEIILFKRGDTNYTTEIIPVTVAVGNNIITVNKPLFGYIGMRAIDTAKFYYVSSGGVGLNSLVLTDLGIPAADPTPATISKAFIERISAPGWDMSLVVTVSEQLSDTRLFNQFNIFSTTASLYKINYVALGDSITALSQGNTYSVQLAAAISATQYTNYAIGGATLAYRAGTTATDNPNPIGTDDTNVVSNQVRKLITAYNNGTINKPDLITISAGINDVFRGHALGNVADEFNNANGTIKDVETVNMYTVTGAMRWSITKLMQTFPDVRIVVLTPLLSSVVERNYAATLPYANKIKEVAGRMGVPVIDCFGESIINEVNQARYMQADMLHPNAAGQKMHFLYVFRKLKNIYYNL